MSLAKPHSENNDVIIIKGIKTYFDTTGIFSIVFIELFVNYITLIACSAKRISAL